MFGRVCTGVGQAVPVVLSLKHTFYCILGAWVVVTVATVKSADALGITARVLTTAFSVTGEPYLIVAF